MCDLCVTSSLASQSHFPMEILIQRAVKCITRILKDCGHVKLENVPVIQWGAGLYLHRFVLKSFGSE